MHALIIIIMERKNCRQAKTINTNQQLHAFVHITQNTQYIYMYIVYIMMPDVYNL